MPVAARSARTTRSASPNRFSPAVQNCPFSPVGQTANPLLEPESSAQSSSGSLLPRVPSLMNLRIDSARSLSFDELAIERPEADELAHRTDAPVTKAFPPRTVSVRTGTGIASTALVVMCQMAGVGVLQLPFMLKQGGYIVLLWMLFCAVMSNYTGKLLIQCCYDDRSDGGSYDGREEDHREGRGRGVGPPPAPRRRRVASSYAEIAALAFGKTGRVITSVFENATLVGVSCLFLILAGKFLEELFPATVSDRVWTVCAGGVVALPLLVLESIKEASFVPLIGVAATLFVVVAVVGSAIAGSHHVNPGKVGVGVLSSTYNKRIVTTLMWFGEGENVVGQSKNRQATFFIRSFTKILLLFSSCEEL